MRLTLIPVVGCLLVATLAQAQTPAPVVQPKSVQIFGQKIYYLESQGTGPAVILLHGSGASSAHWRLTIPALTQFKVYAPDHLGFGQSDKPAINYRIQTLVDMLDEFYLQTGITKATLVGSSMGGWVAAAFAAAHPDKVERLILVDSSGYSQKRWGGPPVDRNTMLRLNPSTLQGMRELLTTLFSNKALVTDAAVKGAFQQKLAAGDGDVINSFIESIMRDEDYLDGKLAGIKAPTFLIWGKDDVLVPAAVAKAFQEDIKGSTLTVLERCGHVPQLECSGPFNTALLAALGGK